MGNEIWQMTQKEYTRSLKGTRVKHVYFNRQGQINYDHQNNVEWALQVGKPVPPLVIADYPDLLRKYG